jgi:hypothetical protein
MENGELRGVIADLLRNPIANGFRAKHGMTA